jgi:hypothetical protein
MSYTINIIHSSLNITENYDVSSSDLTIDKLKQSIIENHNYESVKLIYSGIVLKDDKNLEFYDIESNAILIAIGKVNKMPLLEEQPSQEHNNTLANRTQFIGTNDRSHQMIESGLNIVFNELSNSLLNGTLPSVPSSILFGNTPSSHPNESSLENSSSSIFSSNNPQTSSNPFNTFLSPSSQTSLHQYPSSYTTYFPYNHPSVSSQISTSYVPTPDMIINNPVSEENINLYTHENNLLRNRGYYNETHNYNALIYTSGNINDAENVLLNYT